MMCANQSSLVWKDQPNRQLRQVTTQPRKDHSSFPNKRDISVFHHIYQHLRLQLYAAALTIVTPSPYLALRVPKPYTKREQRKRIVRMGRSWYFSKVYGSFDSILNKLTNVVYVLAAGLNVFAEDLEGFEMHMLTALVLLVMMMSINANFQHTRETLTAGRDEEAQVYQGYRPLSSLFVTSAEIVWQYVSPQSFRSRRWPHEHED